MDEGTCSVVVNGKITNEQISRSDIKKYRATKVVSQGPIAPDTWGIWYDNTVELKDGRVVIIRDTEQQDERGNSNMQKATYISRGYSSPRKRSNILLWLLMITLLAGLIVAIQNMRSNPAAGFCEYPPGCDLPATTKVKLQSGTIRSYCDAHAVIAIAAGGTFEGPALK